MLYFSCYYFVSYSLTWYRPATDGTSDVHAAGTVQYPEFGNGVYQAKFTCMLPRPIMGGEAGVCTRVDKLL
jgi:hypothetical protein